MEVSLPCGQCIGCRLERSRQWALRCYHEAQLHRQNCFITLTFNPENLRDGSLCKRDFQLFMKRLRKKFCSKKSNPKFPYIRYFHCGEYGEKFQRPHHHACLFGFDFPDKRLWNVRDGVHLYTSEVLNEMWPFGFSTVGDVTFESAAYVARYVCKKITGERAEEHYKGRLPEYITMSRRPGIGHDWIGKFTSDVYPRDYVVIRGGRKCKPPKYYDRIYELTDPQVFGRLRRIRKRKALESVDNTPERLEQREVVQIAKASHLKRSFENG